MDKMDTEDEDNNTSLDLASHAKKKLFELGKALGSSLDFQESENLTRNLSLIRGYFAFLTRDTESVFSLSNTHLNNILQSLIIVSKMEPRSTSSVVALCENNNMSVDLCRIIQCWS